MITYWLEYEKGIRAYHDYTKYRKKIRFLESKNIQYKTRVITQLEFNF